MNRQKLIILEGPDSIGKTTQVRELANVFNAKIISQPNGSNLVGYLRKEVKFNESYNSFERQLLHTVSHIVDAFTDFSENTVNLIMDRCHISTYVYGQLTGMTEEQNQLLFKIHQDIFSHVLKDKYDVSLIFLDRDKRYKDEFTDNFEKSFAWENLRNLYLKKFDSLTAQDDKVFSSSERIFYKQIFEETKSEITNQLIQIINCGV